MEVESGRILRGSYQAIDTQNYSDHAEQVDVSQKRDPTFSWAAILTASFGVALLLVILIQNTFLSANQLEKSENLSYCKTICSDPCTSYTSAYGELCCEWVYGDGKGKTCTQMISEEGICYCPNAVSGSLDHRIPPTEEPTVVDDWQPFPGFDPIPWIPLPPIEVPPDAVPCKKHCSNPCAHAKVDHVNYCCDNDDTGSCGTTIVDGKCYCT